MAIVRCQAGWDHHNHPGLYSLLGSGIDISDANTKGQALEVIAKKLNTFAAPVVLVTGWNNAKFELAQSELDIFSRPVIVFNVSFHGAITNTAAEKYLAFPKRTAGILGQGRIVEQAIFITLDRIALDIEQSMAGFLAQQAGLFSAGIVRVDDMFINSAAQVRAYQALKATGELKLEMELWYRPFLIKQLVREESVLMELCTGVKFIMDGAFGVRTAALVTSYTDDPKNRGMLLMESAELQLHIQHMLQLGVKKVAVHCIGDRAIQATLDVYELLHSGGVDTTGWRLEHAELILETQADRAKEMGVILCLQPNFISDCEDYGDRLGDRVSRINPFRMLVDKVGFVPGEDLLLGSDGMPTGLLHGLQTAVNGCTPAQSLTIGESIKGYTVPWPVTSPSFPLNTFVEIEGDLLSPDAKIVRTVINGEEVYKAS